MTWPSLLRKRSAILFYYCVICFMPTVVSGDCNFPSNYQNRFWFRMYNDYTSVGSWTYRLFRTDAIVDNRNDNNSAYQIKTLCSDLYQSPTNQNSLYYLSDLYCVKTVITSNASSILIQELDVRGKAVANSSQCAPLFTEACLNGGGCSASWMIVVNQMAVPSQFETTIQCPFQGIFQLSATYMNISDSCAGNSQSTATAYGSNIQLNICEQFRHSTFKLKTLLVDNVNCVAQLPGEAVNSDETESKVLLLRDQNTFFCARYKNDSSGNILMSINVKNVTSAYCGPGSYATSDSNFLLLKFMTLTIPPSTLPTTIPTTIFTSTSSTTSSANTQSTSTIQSFRPTPTRSTTPPTISDSTGSITTPTIIPASFSTSNGILFSTGNTATNMTIFITPTTPGTTTSSNNSTPSGSTASSKSSLSSLSGTDNGGSTFSSPSTDSTISVTGTSVTGNRGSSLSPPDSIQEPNLDNCPSNACGKGAYCNETTHNCRCSTLFYKYSSNSSKCMQDDGMIDDIFLKTVVPIIAIAAVASIIAGLVLCIATGPLNATTVVATNGAALASKAATPVVVPPVTSDPMSVSYGRNLDTYANIEMIDKSLVTYGDQTRSPQPQQPPNNYVMVGSTIPVKM